MSMSNFQQYFPFVASSMFAHPSFTSYTHDGNEQSPSRVIAENNGWNAETWKHNEHSADGLLPSGELLQKRHEILDTRLRYEYGMDVLTPSGPPYHQQVV